MMFIEIIGRESLPDSLDRDDVEDVDVFRDGDTQECLVQIANVLVALDIG